MNGAGDSDQLFESRGKWAHRHPHSRPDDRYNKAKRNTASHRRDGRFGEVESRDQFRDTFSPRTIYNLALAVTG